MLSKKSSPQSSNKSLNKSLDLSTAKNVQQSASRHSLQIKKPLVIKDDKIIIPSGSKQLYPNLLDDALAAGSSVLKKSKKQRGSPKTKF